MNLRAVSYYSNLHTSIEESNEREEGVSVTEIGDWIKGLGVGSSSHGKEKKLR